MPRTPCRRGGRCGSPPASRPGASGSASRIRGVGLRPSTSGGSLNPSLRPRSTVRGWGSGWRYVPTSLRVLGARLRSPVRQGRAPCFGFSSRPIGPGSMSTRLQPTPMLRSQRSRNRMEKILIIEDEEHLRENLDLLLTDEGYHVVTAENGEEGIQCLVQEPFDLVITDIMMGNVSGFAVMDYIVTHTLDTLVIFITGYASTDSAIAALRKGVYDYIAKPFDIDMLLIAVKRALEKIRLQREIKTYMQELEQRVADRTKELEETNSRLNSSLEELRATQERLIEQRVADRTKELEETNSRLNSSLEELRARSNRRGTNS